MDYHQSHFLPLPTTFGDSHRMHRPTRTHNIRVRTLMGVRIWTLLVRILRVVGVRLSRGRLRLVWVQSLL
jgi:hypothetical protein